MDAALRAAQRTTGDEPIAVLRPLLPSVDAVLPFLRHIDDTRIYSNTARSGASSAMASPPGSVRARGRA